jgi:hypothetical protein
MAPPFLTLAQDAGEWSALPPGRRPRHSSDRKLSGSQSRSGRYGKSLAPAGNGTPADRRVAVHYTNLAIAARITLLSALNDHSFLSW